MLPFELHYRNGVQLSKRGDYTTDEDGLSIVLNEAIVNANDIMVIVSQVPPEEGYDPTNDFDRLDGKIQDNTDAIEGLDVRVTANEEATCPRIASSMSKSSHGSVDVSPRS